jgi:hypothetical protein
MSHTVLKDGDYDLVEGKAWFTLNNLSIRIRSESEQAIVEVYPLHKEMDEPISVTSISFADVIMGDDDEHETI